jgi:alpha-glucosidase
VNQSTWWRDAVIYQVYIRSFADGDADGVGDIAGLRSRLPYLAGLGVDALWINPWYPSPMADGGYDVADHRDIEPVFGTLADADALVADAHAHGLRVILDLVPNHSSDRHPWFREAVASAPGSAARARYLFRPGCGAGGALPPNDWGSTFGGSAWTRVPDGEWYLHLFAPEQPDFDWTHPEVRADFEHTLRFWFDRGVDGFRIDVAHALAKAPGLPDVGDDEDLLDHPHWDREEVHEVYLGWRAIADSYPDPRVFVAEAWVEGPERLARYVMPGRLHTAFNFDYLQAPWLAEPLRRTIDATITAHAEVDAPPTWVLSNHDVVRHVSRYAREQTDRPVHALRDVAGRPADLAVGLRRARAAALLTLALPGGAYVYQGEELGLWEVEDLPDAVLQDPVWERSGHTDKGRDGCRVPIPWSGTEPPFGFSTMGAFLPQPPAWRDLTAEAQHGVESSTLELYRAALRLRREHAGLGDGTLRWLDAGPDVLHFARGAGLSCLVNLSTEPVTPPAGSRVLLASDPLTVDGALPQDTAVWLQS